MTVRISCLLGLIIAITLILPTTTNAEAKKIEFIKGPEKIDVKIDGEFFTSYLYGENVTFNIKAKKLTLGKPILYPLHTPCGIMMTRQYPLVQGKGETTDHPHHSGIAFSHANVNGYDFWSLNKAFSSM